MNELIITNNPSVTNEEFTKERIEKHVDLSQIEILYKARDIIHLGAKLIMHPMAGRIKPHETPYKSIYLEDIRGELDTNSLIMIEDSIAETKKFTEGGFTPKYYDEILSDLAFIDLELIRSGVFDHRQG